MKRVAKGGKEAQSLAEADRRRVQTRRKDGLGGFSRVRDSANMHLDGRTSLSGS